MAALAAAQRAKLKKRPKGKKPAAKKPVKRAKAVPKASKKSPVRKPTKRRA